MQHPISYLYAGTLPRFNQDIAHLGSNVRAPFGIQLLKKCFLRELFLTPTSYSALKPDGEGMVLDESFDNAGDFDNAGSDGLVGDCLPTSEHRRELRRDTLRYARSFPPGAERNELRRVARSLAFFDEQPAAAFDMPRQQTDTGGPRP